MTAIKVMSVHRLIRMILSAKELTSSRRCNSSLSDQEWSGENDTFKQPPRPCYSWKRFRRKWPGTTVNNEHAVLVLIQKMPSGNHQKKFQLSRSRIQHHSTKMQLWRRGAVSVDRPGYGSRTKICWDYVWERNVPTQRYNSIDTNMNDHQRNWHRDLSTKTTHRTCILLTVIGKMTKYYRGTLG